MTLLALAVCLVIPPLVALLPALAGSKFVVLFTTAALAASLTWFFALVYNIPPDDGGHLAPVAWPFYAAIHTGVTLAVVGVPWAIVLARRGDNA